MISKIEIWLKVDARLLFLTNFLKKSEYWSNKLSHRLAQALHSYPFLSFKNYISNNFNLKGETRKLKFLIAMDKMMLITWSA